MGGTQCVKCNYKYRLYSTNIIKEKAIELHIKASSNK